MKKRNTTYRLNIVDYLIFIICSLAAAAALILFYRDLNSYTIKQAEAPVAKIYFKKNTAQRKFVDNDIWEVLTNSSDIYDGDRIRTSKDSEAYTEFNDSGIRGVGWYIDPKYKGNGYATEAARAMIDYMFNECEISEIHTQAAVDNPASWKIMEKLGFKRKDKINLVEYTYLDEPVEDYQYYITKEMYLDRNINSLNKSR